uniref:Uncharacterized protein n=1 Tax=viral metagenome TaxID=1070528 RepID=A0A6C0B9V8_9ZZZZ
MDFNTKVLVKNTGSTETFIDNNGKTEHIKANWDVDYNGKEVIMNVKMDENGKQKEMHANLTNNDIMELLKMRADPMALDRRLNNDFLKSKITFKSIPNAKKTNAKKPKKTKKTKRRH